MDIYTGIKLLIILGYFILGVNVIGMTLLWGRIITLEKKMKVYVASETTILSTGQSLIWDALGGREQIKKIRGRMRSLMIFIGGRDFSV